jgi:Protein of unknown function (DUF2716)
MGALQDCVPTDDWVYVLDWQHPAYDCWPHRVDSELRTDMWPVQVLPNGDYYIFAARDLSFGTFGHPGKAPFVCGEPTYSTPTYSTPSRPVTPASLPVSIAATARPSTIRTSPDPRLQPATVAAANVRLRSYVAGGL